MTMEAGTARLTAGPAVADPKRWWALAATATAQLMIGIDLTIMNIALPSAQQSLHMSDPARQWVITTFALSYGSLLLLGGRLSDLIGRRRSLLIGLAGFATSSALGGAATGPGMLLAARSLQGVFGALMTPSVLAALAAAFPVRAERGKAFAIYGTAMGSSSGLGVLLGGVLTQYLDWRWCMYVNLPIALAAGAGVRYAIRPAARGPRPRLDLPGTLLATVGLIGLVLGFARAEIDGWSATVTIASLTAGTVALAVFVWVQRKVQYPLLPLRVILNRPRGASYVAVLTLAMAVYAALFFLTFYLQDVLRYAPVRAGVAFLPLTAGLIIGSRVAGRLVMRVRARLLLCPGVLILAGGLALLGQLGTDSGYWLHVLPVFLLVGLAAGLVLVTANSTATLNTGPDTAVAGATVMTSQQVGASLGTALLATVSGTAAANYLRSHPGSGTQALVHGLTVASLGAAAFLVLAAVAVFLICGRG
jgi:EmrB/QacA subfamily drug resistance transporter